MVWWKAVSKTATCGVFGSSSRSRSMQASALGLCSGASSSHRASLARASSSTRVASQKYSPPATMRLPTASMASRVSMGEPGLLTITCNSSRRQPGTERPSTGTAAFSKSGANEMFMKACGVPTFSARHFMSEALPSVWMSWALREELPAFTTSTSMGRPRFVGDETRWEKCIPYALGTLRRPVGLPSTADPPLAP